MSLCHLKSNLNCYLSIVILERVQNHQLFMFDGMFSNFSGADGIMNEDYVTVEERGDRDLQCYYTIFNLFILYYTNIINLIRSILINGSI